ncbi:LacI family DNA-binding transcriptional regulator [Lentilactobacillus sp. Marseille-Q4993]|uniref:LacI family DNA-binding transcriptional regulator n=1 Tax=Lentilactobacillus sp. Marseille-Q4993 TaxID=3039492 RepID=UPI0024BD30A9|nr:LacI family DNA-binding transcriptional regulator [Lentilactobacillus sp. Marseille-Q4993]
MPTIRDISKAAQVSPGTVSRALNPNKSSSVSEATRLRIITIAKQMGYSLPEKHTSPDNDSTTNNKHLKFALINTHTIEEETKDEYWRLVRLGIYKQLESEQIDLEKVFDLRSGMQPSDIADYDAVLIVGTISKKTASQLWHFNHKLLVIDGGVNLDQYAHTIDTNFNELTKQALTLLSQKTDKEIAMISGHRREVGLNGTVNDQVEDPRVTAYKEWCLNNNRNQILINTNWSNSDALQHTDDLLDLYGDNLGAIIVNSDSLLAIGTLKSLRNHNIDVGSQISLLSFDDMDFAALLSPALSTISIPKIDLGRAAVLKAKSIAQSSSMNWTERTIIPGDIVFRDTFNS